eukprot:359264-Chlamydomonas_euryale.AAC.8
MSRSYSDVRPNCRSIGPIARSPPAGAVCGRPPTIGPLSPSPLTLTLGYPWPAPPSKVRSLSGAGSRRLADSFAASTAAATRALRSGCDSASVGGDATVAGRGAAE